MATSTLEPDSELSPDKDAERDELEDLYNSSAIPESQPVDADQLEQHYNAASAEEPVYSTSGSEASDTKGNPTKGTEGKSKKSLKKDVPDHDDLSDMENSAGGNSGQYGSDSKGSLYKSAAGAATGGSIWTRLFVTHRRRTVISGGVVGTIIGLVAFFSFLSGPLEIIHMAQLLTQFHFASQQDSADNRLIKMGRFVNYAGKGELQYTRVGVFQAKWGKSLESNLNESGVESAYSSKFRFFDGFVVDPDKLAGTSLESLQGKSPDEIKATIQEKFPGVTIETKATDPGKFFINAKDLGYRKSLALTTFMLQASGKNRLAASIEARVMGSIYGLSWHPFTKVKTSAGRSLESRAEAKKTEAEEVEKGAPDSEVQTSVDTTETPNDQQATATNNATSAEEVADSTESAGQAAGAAAKEGDSSALSGFKDSIHVKLIGGTAGAAGVLCLLRSIGDNASNIKQAQVVLPLARMAALVLAGGSQAQSGQDLDLEQVGYLSEQFNGVDASGNKTSWDQAESIQAELGHPNTGVPPDATLQSIGKSGNPFSFLSSGKLGSILSPVCSTAVQGVISVVSFLGASVVDLTSQVVLAAITPSLENVIAGWIAGDPVDAVGTTGADFGNYINYGARIAANGAALTNGATALTAAQSAQLQTTEDVAWQQQFSHQNIIGKLFNPYDERSAISKVIDSTKPNATQNFASIGSYFLNFRSVLGHLPNLFASTVHAAGVDTTWNYGIPQYGFSEADLDSPVVENPYQNAEEAVGILQGPNGQTYIDRAKKCFGATIAKGSDGIWGVANATIPTYDKIPSDCTDNTQDWLQVRFFIFDTKTADAMGCYYGDETACANVDFDASDSTVTPAAGTGTNDTNTTTTTAGATVDTTALYSDSTSVACAPGTRNLGIQDGYTAGNKVEIRICAIPNLQSTGEESNGGFGVSGANGQAVVNSRVSGAVLAMVNAADKDGVQLDAISSFRTMAHQQALCAGNSLCASGTYTEVAKPGTSNHQMGLAIDFGGNLPSTPGPVAGNAFWTWLTANAAQFGYKNYPAEAWHWSPTGN